MNWRAASPSAASPNCRCARSRPRPRPHSSRNPGVDFFDRLLVAQAMHEPLRFLTANAALKQYSELVELA